MNKHFQGKQILSTIIIIGLTFFLIVNILGLIGITREQLNDYVADEQYMMYQIESKKYDYLSQQCLKLKYSNQTPTEGQKECMAVASYFDASVLYHMYKQTDEPMASKYKKRMDEQVAKMGNLDFVKNEIDALYVD